MFIALAGQANAGKSCLANYLCKAIPSLHPKFHNTTWHTGAFAKKVKDIFCDTFGVDHEFVEKWKRIDTPPPGFDKTVRESLIFIGDGFRSMYSGVWIDNLLRTDKNLIVADGRYLNEMIAIRKKSGFNALIFRPGYENEIQSKSEQELRPFTRELKEGIVNDPEIPIDIFVINNGSERYFHAKAAEMFRELFLLKFKNE